MDWILDLTFMDVVQFALIGGAWIYIGSLIIKLHAVCDRFLGND